MPDAISPAQRRVLRTMYDRAWKGDCWWSWGAICEAHRLRYPEVRRTPMFRTLVALEIAALIERAPVVEQFGGIHYASNTQPLRERRDHDEQVFYLTDKVFRLTIKGVEAAERIVAEEGGGS